MNPTEQNRVRLEHILRSEPDRFDALLTLGRLYGQHGNFAKAAELLGRAVAANPLVAAAHADLGTALKGLQQYERSLQCFDRAIALDPRLALAHCNRGNLLNLMGSFEAALDSYDRALAADPAYADAYFNKGTLLADLRRWDASVASLQAAIALRPGHAESHCNLGVALEGLGRWEAAVAAYDRALSIRPDFYPALSNRGNALGELGRLDQALDSCDRALAIRDDLPDAHCNRGVVLQRMNCLPEAIDDYGRALARNSRHARTRFNRAAALLTLGDFPAGLEDYEWRWTYRKEVEGREPRVFTQPLWRGENSIAGRRILLHAEQGLGDTLQFCRYAADVAALGAAQVILEVPRPLRELLRNVPGVSQIVETGGPLPDVDLHCPLMSLPLALGTRVESIPAPRQYLRADPELTADWSRRIGSNEVA